MRSLVYAMVAAIGVTLTGSARADEQKVPFDKVPKPVLESVKRKFPKAQQLEAAKATENGKTWYDVAIKDNGRMIDVSVTPDGNIQSYEKELPPKDLPKAVKDGINAKFPNSQIDIAAEFIRVNGNRDALEYYQVVLVLSDKRIMATEVTPAGKIQKTDDKTNMK